MESSLKRQSCPTLNDGICRFLMRRYTVDLWTRRYSATSGTVSMLVLSIVLIPIGTLASLIVLVRPALVSTREAVDCVLRLYG
jgi:hypothetical protein